MLLADTSVWIEHFRKGDSELVRLLSDGLVLTHHFVVGELACGTLKNRVATLADLRALPRVVVASDAEVGNLIEDRQLWGLGLGWIDAHLLASAMLTGCAFRTFDRRLAGVAREFGLEPG